MKKILVHGVHRSGTSLISSLLAKAGCWYAEDKFQMPPQRDNPKGFWERIDVVELNDLILSNENLNWFTLIPELQEYQLTRLNDKYEKDISVIAKRIDQHENWFLKDPRLCLTWPLWRKHLSPTHHLVIHRHPVSVAKSLNRRNGIPIQQGLMFWYHQTRMIAKALHSEINVINLDFGKIDNNDSNLLACINQITENSNDLRELKSKDFASLFSSSLVNHVETESNNEVLKDNKVIEKAWDYAKSGDFKKLLDLPEFLTRELSWQDLDSNFAFANQIKKSEREILQHQKVIKKYSKQIVLSNEVIEGQKKDIERQRLEKIKQIEQKSCEIERQKHEIEQQSRGLERQTNEIERQSDEIKRQKNESEQQSSEIERQRVELEHLNERLLNISGKLKDHMNSKRYLLGSVLSKIMRKLGLLRHKELDGILDIAKFGFSASQLEQALPSTPERILLLKAVVRNPIAFVRRVNKKRIVKGVKILLGRGGNSDLGTRQALLQYNVSDFSADTELDIFSPDNSSSWYEQPLKFDAVKNPKVSIVIPVYNNYLTTLACLHSIKKYTQNADISYEIIIADDCSNDETKGIKKSVKGLKVVRGKSNLGFLQNCNYAIPHAKGEFVVLLNNDTNVQDGWLMELLHPLETDSEVGITGPMFIYPDGRLQEAGGIIFDDASGWNYGRFDQYQKPEYNFARDVDYVSGACLVFRKTLWDEIGGFDERFTPAYYEDTDFCFELRSRGLRVRYVPTAKVIHFEGVSHGSSEDSGIKKYQVTNKENFFQKWKKVLQADHCAGPEELFKARLHGRHKKTLLFIDHYVPFHDKDAGSKVAQRYVELFVEQGVHVIFMGDNFYPHQPYTLELQKLGVEVLFGEYYKNNWYQWLQENSTKIDAIYLNRPHISEQYIDKIRALDHVPYLAYHGADLHYVRVGREESMGVKDKDAGRTSAEWKQVEYDLMRKCDISLWLSHQEVDFIRDEDATINVAYKPMYWFDDTNVFSAPKVAKDKNILFVGGFGHPPNLDGLTWFLEQIYPSVIDTYPQVTLTVIGSNCPDEVKQLESDNVKILGFVSEAELVEAYTDARLTVVPLRYGAGVKGKVIESMKFGVPVLTTSIGAEGLPGKPSTYLNVADEPHDFAKALLHLLENDNSCESKIAKSNAALKKYYSKDSAVQAVAKILGTDKSTNKG